MPFPTTLQASVSRLYSAIRRFAFRVQGYLAHKKSCHQRFEHHVVRWPSGVIWPSGLSGLGYVSGQGCKMPGSGICVRVVLCHQAIRRVCHAHHAILHVMPIMHHAINPIMPSGGHVRSRSAYAGCSLSAIMPSGVLPSRVLWPSNGSCPSCTLPAGL